MKKDKTAPKISNDLNRVKKALNGENTPLPEGLSQESIVALVSGEKQKTPKKKAVRRFIASAVAACIVICSLAVFDSAVYAPEISVPENSVAYAKSYSELSRLMKDYFKTLNFRNELTRFNSSYGHKSIVDGAPESISTPRDTAIAMESSQSKSTNFSDDGTAFSETNLREAGIYEADIVKTDGTYIYALANSNFFILNASDLSLVSTFKVTADMVKNTQELKDTQYTTRKSFSEFYVVGNTLVLEASGNLPNSSKSYYENVYSGVDIYDISKKENPVKLREIAFDGACVSTRITDGKLVLITSYQVYQNSFSADDYTTFLPGIYNNGEKTYPEADSIAIADTKAPDRFLTVAKIDLADPANAKPSVLTVFGAGTEVYCTAKTLYVYCNNYYVGDFAFTYGSIARKAVADYDSTDIMAFDISADTPVFLAKCCVEGFITDTWALDEHKGYLRVAAKSDGTYVYVFDSELKQVGKSERLARGEEIKSVRFMGDTAYIVTFYQTDPLFVLDLSDPAKPQVTGELKIPGFSSYLHPVGENLLMGVGVGGTEIGTDGSAKLSLFDVSDPANPREISVFSIENAWFESNYKAFVSVGDGSFIIPVRCYAYNTALDSYDWYYKMREELGAVRVAVRDGEIVCLARYYANEDRSNVFWLRALFIGDRVYTLSHAWKDTYYNDGFGSDLEIIAFNMDSGEKLLQKTYEAYDASKILIQ